MIQLVSTILIVEVSTAYIFEVNDRLKLLKVQCISLLDSNGRVLSRQSEHNMLAL